MKDKLEKDYPMSTETTMATISKEDVRDKQDKTSVELLPLENITSGNQLEDRSDGDSAKTKDAGAVILEEDTTDVKMNTVDETNRDQDNTPVTDLDEPELHTGLATTTETERNAVSDNNDADRHLNAFDAVNTEESLTWISQPNICGIFPVDVWAIICDYGDKQTVMTLRSLNSIIGHCADRVVFRQIDFGLHSVLIDYFHNIAGSEKLRPLVQEVTVLDFNLQMLNEAYLKQLMTWEEWQQHTRNFKYESILSSDRSSKATHMLKYLLTSLPNLRIIKTRQSFRIFDMKEETTDRLGNVVSKWRPKDMEQVMSRRWKWGNWEWKRNCIQNPPLPLNPRLLAGVFAALQNSEGEKSLREVDVLIPQDFWFKMKGIRLCFLANVRVMRLKLYLDRTARLPSTIQRKLVQFISSAPLLEVLDLEIGVDPKNELESTLGGESPGANFPVPGGLLINCRIPGIRGVPPFKLPSPLNENSSFTTDPSIPNSSTFGPNSGPDPGPHHLNSVSNTEEIFLGQEFMEIRGGIMPHLGPILTQALIGPWPLLKAVTVMTFYGLTGHTPNSPRVYNLQQFIGNRLIALNRRLFRGPPPDIGTVLKDLKLPNLRALKIGGASSQSFIMENFLERHSETLRSLSLRSIHLKEGWEDADLRHALKNYYYTGSPLPTICKQGPWKRLIENIKPCMKLESANIWEVADMKILYFVEVLRTKPLLTDWRWREKYQLWTIMLGSSLMKVNVNVESLNIADEVGNIQELNSHDIGAEG